MDNTTDTKIWLNKEAERRLREVSDKINHGELSCYGDVVV